MRKIVLISAALVLGGCGYYVTIWEKPGATPQEEEMIGKKCQYEAEAHVQKGILTEYERSEQVRKLRDMCLEANGMVRKRQEYRSN